MQRNVSKQAEIGKKMLPSQYEMSLDEFRDLLRIFSEAAVKGGIPKGAYISESAYINGLVEAVGDAYYMGFALGVQYSGKMAKKEA